jgi:hypothetical protein
VDEACETDAGDVARRAEDAFEVPDGFCSGQTFNRVMAVIERRYLRLRVDFVQESTAIVL